MPRANYEEYGNMKQHHVMFYACFKGYFVTDFQVYANLIVTLTRLQTLNKYMHMFQLQSMNEI